MYVDKFLDKVDKIENKLAYITNNTENRKPRQLRSTQRKLTRLLTNIDELISKIHMYQRVIVYQQEPVSNSSLYRLYRVLRNQNFWMNHNDVVVYQRHVILDIIERLDNIRYDILETLDELLDNEPS